MDKANRLVAEYALEPNGIDSDTRSLQAVASVTLKAWYEDTEILLLGKIGEDEISMLMTDVGNGMTKKESLVGWGEFSMLLPLRNGGGGWSGPEYRDDVMSSQFDISIEGQEEKPSFVDNPQFLTFRNGELPDHVLSALWKRNLKSQFDKGGV